MKHIFFIFLLSVFGISYGQHKQINQLKKQLEKENLTDSTKIKLYGDLGWYYSNVSIDSAFKYSRKALDLSKKSNNRNGIAQSFNDIGIIYYRISNFDTAIAYYKKALKLRIQSRDSVRIAAIYNKIGIAHNQLFKLDSAIYYSIESLKIYEGMGLKKYVAVSHNNIANLYRDTKQYKKALETHRLALDIRNEINDNPGKVQSFVGLGNIYVFLKKMDSAQFYYEKSIELGEPLGMKRDISASYNNLGNIYKEAEKYNKAIQYFNKAKDIRMQLNDRYGLASTSLNLGDMYLRSNQFYQSQKNLHQSLSISKSIKADELIHNNYRALLQLKAKQRQADSTLFYFNEYSQLQDSLLSKEILSQVSNYETQYKTEKKEKEIAIQKQELLNQELKLKNRNLYIIIISASLIILIILSITIYKRQLLKKEQLEKEMELKEVLNEIETRNKLQEQRLEISRDLHDNIGSQLTFIISSIDNLKFISKDLSKTIQEKLTGISGFTSDTIHQLRDTIWAMNKNSISFDEFHTRMLSYIEKAKVAASNIQFEIDAENINHTFSSVVGMHLFRVIQEAVNNSIKYSEASKINLHFYQKDKNISIKIFDNGIGFEKENGGSGNGLMNMETRIEKIGGTITIDSEKGKGTNISIKLPK